MKNSKLTLAILAMVVATLVSVVVVSCKKEGNATLPVQNPVKERFTPPQVDDMNAYLKDFKQKMQSATKGDDEVLSLEEAAWHLSSVANYDFGKVNIGFNDFIIDTLYEQINIVENRVFMSELNLTYDKISTNINKYLHNLYLSNKHVHFVDMLISESGSIAIQLMITYTSNNRGIYDTLWNFTYSDSINPIEEYCGQFEADQPPFIWNGYGKEKLEYALNCLESHSTDSTSHNAFYTFTRQHTFEFHDDIDPFGSPSCFNARLYGLGGWNHALSSENMCYYYDSYAGLGYKYLQDNYYVPNEHPVLWSISCDNGSFYPYHWTIYYHNLLVKYGKYNIGGNGGNEKN